MASRKRARTIARLRTAPAPAPRNKTRKKTRGSPCRKVRAKKSPAVLCKRRNNGVSAAARDIGTIPVSAGIGLRAPHYDAVVTTAPDVGWLEVHSENFFGNGGPPLRYLDRARSLYPVSLHGVGLSLGSVDALSRTHLDSLKRLIERIEPGLVSDHLSWSSIGGRYLNDLLPLPYTEESLRHLVGRIVQTQEYLGRQMLIENPSSYLEYKHSTIPEWEFIAAVAAQADCGILLDVNNVYVSASNHGFDPLVYLRGIPASRVQEIHLAGHMVKRFDDGEILIDTHNTRVSADVWALYREALSLVGERPTLIEWDSDLPALDVLLDEAQIASGFMRGSRDAVAA